MQLPPPDPSGEHVVPLGQQPLTLSHKNHPSGQVLSLFTSSLTEGVSSIAIRRASLMEAVATIIAMRLNREWKLSFMFICGWTCIWVLDSSKYFLRLILLFCHIISHGWKEYTQFLFSRGTARAEGHYLLSIHAICQEKIRTEEIIILHGGEVLIIHLRII